MIAGAALSLGLVSSQVVREANPQAAPPPVVCGTQVPEPAALPPLESGPVVFQIVLCFEAQGGTSVIDAQTYLYYIHLKPSRPSQGAWTPYDDSAEQTIREDFRRLWATNFLDNLSIDVTDYPFANGVTGKLIVYNVEERQRVKIVDYIGSRAIETSKIDERLKEQNADVRIDTFTDASQIRKIEGILRVMMQEKGFEYAEITHQITTLPGGPKLVHLTFNIEEGPIVRVRDLRFSGNTVATSRTLRKQLKNTKASGWLPFLFGRGVYQEGTVDEDIQRVVEFYQDLGYIKVQVDRPRVTVDGDSRDKKTRWVTLQIPIVEGARYRVKTFDVTGNTVLKSPAVTALFKIKPGDVYSLKAVRDGLVKARELYGAGGYFEFTAFPEYKFSDEPPLQPAPAEPPTVDVAMHLLEGTQFLVNRISVVGNTTTRDNVIRRELQLAENGIFNTEALKYSVRRLNQLGYFKPLDEQKGIAVQKTPGVDGKVDVTLKVEEQNRNQVQFGAGVSEFEGLFGNVSYTTTNWLGRGESLNVTLQKGVRGNVYQVGVTEPYLFERPIVASAQLYSRKTDYYTTSTAAPTANVLGTSTTSSITYSEVREGSTWSIGRPVRRFSRLYVNYTYELADVWIADSLLSPTASAGAGTPLFNPAVDKGRHVDSRVTPTFVYNTVDNPITPHSGSRVTGSVQMAGAALRGSYDYLKPEFEVITYIPTSRRTGFGLRGQAGLLHTYGDTTAVPYYLRYFLGGEYQIRGVDYRTVGPLNSSNQALGGNKFLLFNAEYYLDLFGPVRLLAFHDAGQAFAEDQPFNLRNLRTSSGGELRVLVPMINVPFRLIYFVNIYRDTFQPYRGLKFSVGTTF